MSTETPVTITVTRNETTWDFVKAEKSRGKDKGATVYVPVQPRWDDDADVQRFLNWNGLKTTLENEFAKLRQIAMGWTRSATANGEFIVDAFTKYASEFSARGESIKELQEQIEDLMVEVTKLYESGLDPVELGKQITGKFAEIKKLREVIEAKRRDKEEDESDANGATATAAKA